MKQVYRILFLFLAIVFSFGYTNPNCLCKVKQEQTHSCCKSSDEKEPVHKECKGECCVHTTTVSKLEEVITATSSKQSKLNSKGSFEKVRSDFSAFYTDSIGKDSDFHFDLHSHPTLKIPDFIQEKTQSWLI